jgi:hypothetical protein
MWSRPLACPFFSFFFFSYLNFLIGGGAECGVGQGVDPVGGCEYLFPLPQVSTWSEKIFFEARDLVTLAEWWPARKGGAWLSSNSFAASQIPSPF